MRSQSTLICFIVMGLSACGGGDPDPSVIGTQVTLTGVVSSASTVITMDANTTIASPTVSSNLKQPRSSHSGGTGNLLALDATGNTFNAMESDKDYTVLYTTTDKNKANLYIAMDPADNEVPAFSNCAIYKISLSNDAVSCVVEGVRALPRDTSWDKVNDPSAKPIQFDLNGNMYFLGQEFSRSCNTDNSSCTISYSNGTATYAHRLYKIDTSGALADITPDSENVQSFLVLQTGEVAYHGLNIDTGSEILRVLTTGAGVTIKDGTISSYSTDGGNTVIYDDFNMVRPLSTGGVERAYIDVSSYPSSGTSLHADGKIFMRAGQNIHQVLPAKSGVIATLGTAGTVSDDYYVRRNFIFHVTTRNDINYGPVDSIRVEDLDGVETTRELLSATNSEIGSGRNYYDIFNWSVSEDIIVFSGLDRYGQVVLGEIDIPRLVAGEAEATYLTVKSVDSAVAAASKVKDYQLLHATNSVDPTSAPEVLAYTIPSSASETASISITFSKPMDTQSVEQYLTLTNTTDSVSVEYVPVWIGNTLHLIGKSSVVDVPAMLIADVDNYTVELNIATQDIYGEILGSGSTSTYPLSHQFVLIPPVSNNIAPVANDDVVHIVVGVSADPVAVLDNDTDANVGDTLTVTSNTTPVSGVTEISSGVFVIGEDWTRPSRYDFMDYTISDGTDTATATLHAYHETPMKGGSGHMLMLDPNLGTIRTCGKNSYGQLGDGTNLLRSSPVSVTALSNVAAIEAGGQHSVALLKDGTVWAWGQNQFGQVGLASGTPNSIAPVQISGLDGVMQISASNNQNLALKIDGTVWAWGQNTYGQLGNGSVVTHSEIPVQVSGLTGVRHISAGMEHNMALKEDGTVWAWGNGTSGQLGNGGIVQSNVPVQVVTSLSPQTPLTGVANIDAGGIFSLALMNDGTIKSWGAGTSGQLGNNDIIPSSLPVSVQYTGGTAVTNAYSISAGNNFALAIVANGGGSRVIAWGANTYGQTGNPTGILQYDYALNVQMNDLTDATQIDMIGATAIHAGTNSNAYAMISNKVYSWGYDGLSGVPDEQLCNGATGDTPYAAGNGTQYIWP